jgi:tetratricopeptide (TPR) repeat protein
LDAENVFFKAVRLSRRTANHYHLDSIRHLAHMQYLQRRYKEARNTIAQAVHLAPTDYNVLYDAARYAARAGQTAEALSFLERCIAIRPETLRTMFAEQDFLT